MSGTAVSKGLLGWFGPFRTTAAAFSDTGEQWKVCTVYMLFHTPERISVGLGGAITLHQAPPDRFTKTFYCETNGSRSFAAILIGWLVWSFCGFNLLSSH